MHSFEREVKKTLNVMDGEDAQAELTFELNTLAGLTAFYNAVDCVRLLDSKQLDYGPMNISTEGLMGLKTRLVDKIFRLKNILESGNEPNHESLKDTFQDIANYGLIGQMLIEGTWPNVEKKSTKHIEITVI